MSTSVWDGGCWIVLDRDCEPVDGEHLPTEAAAHAISIPAGLYVRREQCDCNANWSPPPAPASTVTDEIGDQIRALLRRRKQAPAPAPVLPPIDIKDCPTGTHSPTAGLFGKSLCDCPTGTASPARLV